MSSFVIEGGYRLSGEIVPQGAKNEALEVICATLLTPEKVTIHNVPDILDVNNLIQLLRDMRVKVEHPSADTYTFQADDVDMEYLSTEEFLRKSGSLRGSVMIVGPLRQGADPETGWRQDRATPAGYALRGNPEAGRLL